VPVQTTYYSEQELEALEHIAEVNDDSFSSVVRTAIQEHYAISEVMEQAND